MPGSAYPSLRYMKKMDAGITRGGFRDHRAGEHRVPHAVVESDSLELLVNLGSIDNVSRKPHRPAPCGKSDPALFALLASRDASAATI